MLDRLPWNRNQAGTAIAAEVEAEFAKFGNAQNTRDEASVSRLLRCGPDFLWVTATAATVWGHDAAMQRYLGDWKHEWKLDPDMQALRFVEMGQDTAILYMPLKVIFACQGKDVRTVPVKWSGVFLRTPEGGGSLASSRRLIPSQD